MRGRTRFLSESTAPTWDRGMLVGSGRVGAVVWGGPDEHVVSLSHERFFLPVNPRTPPPSFAQVMPQVRAALLAHDTAAAAALVDEVSGSTDFAGMIWTDPLGPGAELALVVHGSGEATAYRRRRDLESGEVAVAWEQGGRPREIRVCAPRGGRCISLRVRAAEPSSVSLRLGVTGERTADIAGAVSYAGLAEASVRVLDLRAAAVVVSAGAHGQKATLTTTVRVGAGEATLAAGETAAEFTIPLDGGSWTEIAVELAYGDDDPLTIGLGDGAALQRACRLDLRSRVSEEVPTEELLRRALSDSQSMRALIELAFAAGRANIIAATGDLPATLQGVWQGTWSPAWSADYTLNGNVQNGGMASLIPTGTPALMASLTRLLVPHLEDFRTNAARIFGLDGAMLPARMSTHGLANHFVGAFPHQFWISGGGWVLRMLADAVLSSGDRRLVDDETWKLAEEVLGFARAVISRGPVAPSYSPENTPGEATTPLTVNATMDVAVLRDADRAGRVLAEAHGAAPIILPEVAPAYRVDGAGRLAEWADPAFAPHLAHRHTSELYPLWYELDPAFEDRELRAAATRLIRAKLDWRAEDLGPPPGNGEMAFGLAQLGLAAATLGDAQSAELCVRWLAALHFTPAMSTTHDTGAIFNLDASGALPAVVAAMLVGSTRERIMLLPALPDSWAEGAVCGLTTRTAWTLDRLEWGADGVVVALNATPDSAWVRTGPVELRLPRPVTSPGRPDPVTSILLDHRETRHHLSLTWASAAT